MIQKFKIINKNSGDSLELELTKPALTGIYVRDVTGLGYPSSNISITHLVTSDIGFFNQSLFSERNIVFSFSFIPNGEVEKNRAKLRKVFIQKTFIRIEIYTDAIEDYLYTEGLVETFDSNIFSKDETIQISIICPNPYLIGPNPIVTETVGNPSIFTTRMEIDQGYRIEISSEQGIDNLQIEYINGKIIYGSGKIKNPYKEDIDLTDNSIDPNEKIIIDTTIEKYGVYMLRSDTQEEEDITDRCIMEGDFPILTFGSNKFSYIANGLYVSDDSPYRMEYSGDYDHYNITENVYQTYENLDEIFGSILYPDDPNSLIDITRFGHVKYYTAQTYNIYRLVINFYDGSEKLENYIGKIVFDFSSNEDFPSGYSLGFAILHNSESYSDIDFDELLKSFKYVVYEDMYMTNSINYLEDSRDITDYVVEESINQFYTGDLDLSKGIRYLLLFCSIQNPLSSIAKAGNFVIEEMTDYLGVSPMPPAYRYGDISVDVNTKIIYPDYRAGL